MRKWIVIGALAVIGAGILAYVMSGPKRGSVEYHLEEYNRTLRELRGYTWRDRCAEAWSELTGKPYQPSYMNPIAESNACARLEKHEQALINLGHWEVREFCLTNISAAQVSKSLNGFAATLPPGDTSEIRYLDETNKIMIRSLRIDMPKWAEVVRKAETGAQ
jgi:hypothetical protein